VDTVGVTDAALAQETMETFNGISYAINSQAVGSALPNSVAAVAAATSNGTALTIAGEQQFDVHSFGTLR
jgi:Arc/MetJ family transcription regulator